MAFIEGCSTPLVDCINIRALFDQHLILVDITDREPSPEPAIETLQTQGRSMIMISS